MTAVVGHYPSLAHHVISRGRISMGKYSKSILVGLCVAVVTYGSLHGLENFQTASGAKALAGLSPSVSPTLSPTKKVTQGDKTGDKKVVTSLSPRLSPLSPSLSPSVIVTPRATMVPTNTVLPATPSPSPTPSVVVTPRPTTIPTPTPTPTPTSTTTPLPSPTSTPTTSPTPSAPIRIVINEVAWAGTVASQYGEWFELYNVGAVSVDLSGWKLMKVKADGSVVLVFALHESIGPNSYYLVERTTDTSPDPIDITADVFGAFSNSGFANTGEHLFLYDADGQVVDEIGPGVWYGGDNQSKTSMERINATLPGNDPSNWASNDGTVTTGTDAAGNPIRGTPKFKNSVTL